MKKHALISSIVITAAFGLLAVDVLSQKVDSKVDAFHASLKYEASSDYAKAIQAILPTSEKYKDDYLLNLRLGWLYYLKRNYTESWQYYSNAAKLNNKGTEALFGRTLPLAAMGQWENVEADYRAILDLNPMEYSANLRLGQILLSKGAYAEAKSYLEKAYSQYPGTYDPNLSLGWTYYYLGNKKKAESLLTAALMLSPGDTLATMGLSLIR